MESMEEFTFKPITEGLGFHNKKEKPKKSNKGMESAPVAITPFSEPKNIKMETTPAKSLKSPLPKKETIPTPLEVPTKEVIDDLVRNFKKTKETTTPELPQKTHALPKVAPTEKVEKKSALPWMLSPFIVDGMLVMALVLSALMVILLVTQVDLIKVMTENPEDVELWASLPLIALVMYFSYMSLSRIFLGSSLGEIVFDVQLGTHEDQNKTSYNFLVMGRSLLIMVTGFFVLPLLSLIMRKDYVGQLSGIRLYSRK